MEDRGETSAIWSGRAPRRLKGRRWARACLTPMCLVNLAVAGSVIITSLSTGGSALHGLAGCFGVGLAAVGLFWGAERAGWRPGHRPSLLTLVLTVLVVMSLGVAGLTGLHLAAVQGAVQAFDPTVAKLHGHVAALAFFVTPLSLAATLRRRLSRLPVGGCGGTSPALPMGAR